MDLVGFFWYNGQIYHGQYDQDKKEGWGEFFWPDKKTYNGWWKSGKQNGFGTFRSPRGEERCGVWQNGQRLEWLSTPEEISRYKKEHDVPEDPELPEMPDWLEELHKQAFPSWYKEQLGMP